MIWILDHLEILIFGILDSKFDGKIRGPAASGPLFLNDLLDIGYIFLLESRPAAQIAQFGVLVTIFLELNYFS